MFYIKDVVRDQIGGDGVKRLIKQTAAIDVMQLGKNNYNIWLPQDPGQAGKVQAKDFVVMLAGYNVRTELESGDKETRARPSWQRAPRARQVDRGVPQRGGGISGRALR
jgi:phage terminase large subunit-like protein